MKVSFHEHYERIRKHAVERARLLLHNQIVDRDSPGFGGFINHLDGLIHPGSGPGSLLTLIPVFLHPDSELFGDEELRQRLRMVFDFTERIQREDGTFDLLTTNFYSSPDNGFIMHNLARAWRVLTSLSSSPACPDCTAIKEKFLRLIERTAAGMVKGGFHTPNHRWVIAAALAMAYNITGKEELLATANRYLAEGIDCDENGEFTERSSGIYNAVNDNALIILADELERTEFLDPVVKNLEMMFSYIEPDGSIFTWNSTRQDGAGQGAGQGASTPKHYPTPYYHIYAMMLRRRGDPRYAWMAESIFNRSDQPPSCLWLYMLEPELQTLETAAAPAADQFEHHYDGSGIVRIRRRNLGITIMRDSSSFLFISTKELCCRIKLCASFFGKGQFKADSIAPSGDGYALNFKQTGDYRLPLDPPPENPDWKRMDHSLREHVRILNLEFTVSILPLADGVEIEIESTGCDRVPTKLEIIFDGSCMVQGDAFCLAGNPGQGITVTAGAVKVRKGGDAMDIGPAFGEHHYSDAMRGSEPRSTDGFTLYFTDFTPMRRRVKIKKAN